MKTVTTSYLATIQQGHRPCPMAHIHLHTVQAHICSLQVWTRHKCLNFLNYGLSEDPAKRTYSRMAFVERGPSPAIGSANSSQVGTWRPWQSVLQRARRDCQRAGCRADTIGFKQRSAHRHAAASPGERQHTRPPGSSTRDLNERSQHEREQRGDQHASGSNRGRIVLCRASARASLTTVKVKTPSK